MVAGLATERGPAFVLGVKFGHKRAAKSFSNERITTRADGQAAWYLCCSTISWLVIGHGLDAEALRARCLRASIASDPGPCPRTWCNSPALNP